ncbi:hypothetical protein FQR65_LT04772 [Abscondita terminalis]|nr:hypothetical protein FQR65_LT04772 [Abscondita terminalis]
MNEPQMHSEFVRNTADIAQNGNEDDGALDGAVATQETIKCVSNEETNDDSSSDEVALFFLRKATAIQLWFDLERGSSQPFSSKNLNLGSNFGNGNVHRF